MYSFCLRLISSRVRRVFSAGIVGVLMIDLGAECLHEFDSELRPNIINQLAGWRPTSCEIAPPTIIRSPDEILRSTRSARAGAADGGAFLGSDRDAIRHPRARGRSPEADRSYSRRSRTIDFRSRPADHARATVLQP